MIRAGSGDSLCRSPILSRHLGGNTTELLFQLKAEDWQTVWEKSDLYRAENADQDIAAELRFMGGNPKLLGGGGKPQFGGPAPFGI